MTEDRGEKRVALVTGSTSGIGMAIAKRLAKDGFTVAFHSKSSVLIGQSLAEAHLGSSYFQADLSDQSQSRNLQYSGQFLRQKLEPAFCHYNLPLSRRSKPALYGW